MTDEEMRVNSYAAAIWKAGSTRPWGVTNEHERSRYRDHARAAIRVADQERSWRTSVFPSSEERVDPSSVASGAKLPSSEESWWADAKRAADQASESMELVGSEMSDQEVRAAALQAAYYVGEYQEDAAALIAIARKLEEYIRNG